MSSPLEGNKTEFCVIGPIPLHLLVVAFTQIDRQGWEIRFVAFAGMVSPRLAVAGRPQAFPAYVIIAEKEFMPGQEVVFPALDFGKEGGDAGNRN